MNRTAWIAMLVSVSVGSGAETVQPEEWHPGLRLGSALGSPSGTGVREVSSARHSLAGSPRGYRVETGRREEVRSFYKTVYAASLGIEPAWTGNYGACHPGGTKLAYKEAVIRRVNYFRAMAGVPASVGLDSDYSVKAQEAALMMSAQGALDHFPSAGWACYTPEGYEAAGKSNLALGSTGPEAIDGYMEDYGRGNEAAGHRRWLLYPQTQRMGTGDVPGEGATLPANATWVFDGNFGRERPPTRDAFVAWPPPGYVPFSQVFNRWSFSHPDGDFSRASVQVTSNGVPVAVRLEGIASNIGEPTLVWYFVGTNPLERSRAPRPVADVVYEITLRGVRVGDASTDFTYTVRAFDPEVPGPDTVLPVLQGPTRVPVGVPSAYSFEGIGLADGYQWRQATREAGLVADGAEAGLAGFRVDTSPNYDVVVRTPVASGASALHLAHPAPPSDQVLERRETFLIASNSELRFRSRLGRATTLQSALVEVSEDDGVSWLEAYRQAGTNGAGEAAYHPRAVGLGGWAGRTLRIRFVYRFGGNGSYYPQTSDGIGWYLDDIELHNVERLGAMGVPTTISGSSFAFRPVSEGGYLLQARALAFGGLPLEWGPAFLVGASGSAPAVLSWVAGAPRFANGKWLLEFQVLEGTAPASFDLEQTTGTAPWRWSVTPGAVLETITPGREYRFTVGAGAGNSGGTFFRVRGS